MSSNDKIDFDGYGTIKIIIPVEEVKKILESKQLSYVDFPNNITDNITDNIEFLKGLIEFYKNLNSKILSDVSKLLSKKNIQSTSLKDMIELIILLD